MVKVREKRAAGTSGIEEKAGGGDQPPLVRVGTIAPEGKPCEAPSAVSCTFIIFGATGDLTRRKLIPSLYRLAASGVLTDKFQVVGASRTPLTTDSFRTDMESSVRNTVESFDVKAWESFARKLHYMPIDFSDTGSYRELMKLIDGLESENGIEGNRLFYVATPPSVYRPIIENLGEAGAAIEEKGWTHVVVEKPFGRDLASARELDAVAHGYFREEQIYRIDHYLGKETVQNILMLRFANTIFEPIWNRRYVDHVQITVAETLGVEKRAGYYEQAGVLRDMFQNHILQVLSLIAMEPPSVFESELVRDERVKVLRALRPMPMDNLEKHVVIGQYSQGEIGGEEVPGYRREYEVAPDSEVPTYAALEIYIDNWRWQGVPFYLRSGKRLKKRFSEVVIQFKQVPHRLFEEAMEEEIGPNALVLGIQPDERVQLRFHTKNPGTRMCLRDVLMDFPYLEGYSGMTFEAYERVLLDCMAGEKTLFVRTDGIELSWAFITPLLEFLESGGGKKGTRPELEEYRAGSWGPEGAENLIRKGGRRWKNYD